MVLPLVDEHRPKCYMCSAGFEDIDSLRKHQESGICRPREKAGPVSDSRQPAPGDVSLF